MRSAARRISAACVAGALAIALAACAESQRDSGDEQGGAGATGGTMVFGAAGAPRSFDPLFAQDPIFNSVRDPEARERLVARFSLERTQPSWALAYEWDIVLRGREETPMEEAL